MQNIIRQRNTHKDACMQWMEDTWHGAWQKHGAVHKRHVADTWVFAWDTCCHVSHAWEGVCITSKWHARWRIGVHVFHVKA